MSRPARLSAGIALLRRVGPDPTQVELLLVHPGGPFWAGKDIHGWSIPKGELDPTADPDADVRAHPTAGAIQGAQLGGVDVTGAELEVTARREFTEETGQPVPPGPLMALPSFSVGSGKRLHAFWLEGEIDADAVVSNEFELEWPPRSGRLQRFPEVDRAAWYDLDTARTRLHKGQVKLVDLLASALQAG